MNNLPKFTNKPGINKDLASLKTPIEFFQLFFSDHLLHEVCDMTNKYCQENKNTKKVSKHKKKWVTPDLPTIKCFFGFVYGDS